MSSFLDHYFFAAVALVFIFLPLRPKGLNRTFWFGVLNFLALASISGLRAPLLAVAIAGVLWFALFIHQTLPNNSVGARRVLEVAIYSGLTIVFLFHKAILDLGKSPAGIHTTILQTIAFSYVYLRSLDAARVAISGGTLLDPVSMSGYLSPFFMSPAGPVNVYADHARMNDGVAKPPSWSSFIDAADTITSGLFLKYVVAEIWKFYFVGSSSAWPTDTFVDSVVIFVYVYFDFWGYSLVALGIGSLLGVPTPRNFLAPFRSTSLTEFWTRWHVSLGDFVRRGLFFPLQLTMVRRFGRKWAYLTNLVALVLSFAFVGLWHRLGLTFLGWGLLVGVVVAAEKIVRDWWVKTELSKNSHFALAHRILGPIYVFIFVVGTLHIAMPALLGQHR